MNALEPRLAILQWLEDGENVAVQIAMAIGFNPKNKVEAISVISDWILQPRDSFELRSAELSLRAFIDFECFIGSADAHQDFIDREFLNAVDAAAIPSSNRLAINDAIGGRQEQREQNLVSMATWKHARPSDAAIYEWWMKRTQDWLQSLKQPPTQ